MEAPAYVPPDQLARRSYESARRRRQVMDVSEIVGDLQGRYKLAKAQLALLPEPKDDPDEKFSGTRYECEEVMETHRAPPSGAVGEHRDGREQYKNRQEAFKKCCESDKFKAWHNVEVMRRRGQLSDIQTRVDSAMLEHNLKIEYFPTAEERRNMLGVHGS